MSDYKPATWTGLEMHLNAEIARLRAINAELLEALEWLQLTCEGDGDAFEEAYKSAEDLIAKAKETA